jgi:hypothetical protein
VSGADNTSLTVRKNSTPFTIDHSPGANDTVLIYNANNTQTAYLPPAASLPPGRVLYFVNATSSTLNVFCTDQLDGVPGGTATPARSAQFVSDGANWWTISNN